MFKWIYILLFINFCFAQEVIRTTPQIHDWYTIYDGILGDHGDGIDTTKSFSARQWAGHVATAMELDSTGYADSDSCILPMLQFKRRGMDWGTYYNLTVDYVTLDTIARKWQHASLYMSLTDEVTGFLSIDSLRYIFKLGVGDSIDVLIQVGGQ